MWVISIFGITLFLFTKEPANRDLSQVNPRATRPENKQINFTKITSGSESERILEYKSSSNFEESTNFKQFSKLRSTRSLLWTLKLIKLLFLITLSGIVVSFYSGILVKLISNSIISGDNNRKIEYSFYCMIVLGLGELIGALFISPTLDRFHPLVSIMLFTVTFLGSVAITYYANMYWKFGLIWFASSFLWGMSDSQSNIILCVLCWTEFGGAKKEAMAIFKSVQSVAIFLCFMLQPILNDIDQKQLQKYFMISIAIFSLVAWLTSWSIKFTKLELRKQRSSEPSL